MKGKLQEYALVAEIVSAIAIVCSLIFVGLQIRQNTNVIGGTTIQGIAEQSMNSTFQGLASPELRLAWQRGFQGNECLAPEDADILGWWYASWIRITENRFRQIQLGTISAAAGEQVGGNSDGLRHPYFNYYWKYNQSAYPADFVLWVEENILPFVQDKVETFPDELLMPEALECK